MSNSPEKKPNIFDEEYMGTLISPYSRAIITFTEGDIIQGRIKEIREDRIYLDVGINCQAIIPREEFTTEGFIPLAELVNIDDRIEAYILSIDREEGKLILSKKKADYELAWQKVQKIYEAHEIVEVKVKKVVKDCLIIDIFSLEGILPASQIDVSKSDNLLPYVNQVLPVKIIELDRSKDRIVVSRRVVLEEEKEASHKALLATMKPGSIVKGKVKNITNYGVFVDLGSDLVGLIHVSELAWRRIEHPREILREGEEVTVKVLNVDYENKRIALGLKQLQEDPWEKVEEKYKIGSLIEGKISKIAPFGLFVKLDENIEGLVHLSELREGEISKLGEIYTIGDRVLVKVLDIKKQARKIYLSIKQAEEEKERLEYRKYIEEHKPEEITVGEMFKELFEKKE